MKRLLRTFLIVVGAFALVGVVLFGVMGLRLQFTGDGSPTLGRPIDWNAHYEQLERERQAQKASAPVPAVAATTEPDKAATAVAASPTAAPVVAQAVAPAVAETAKVVPAAMANQPVAKQPAIGGWTAYRGVNRDGVYRQTDIPSKWSDGKLQELWRHPIGGGYASFAIAEGKLFTIEQRRDKETVAAYEAQTGKEIWADSYAAHFSESMGGDGPRTTPTYHEGKLYSVGATGEFRCLDAATGKVLWRKNILEEAGADNLTWGMSASPLIVDNLVVVQPGGSKGNSVIAYDRNTGTKVWGSLNDKAAYVSPMIMTLAGKRQVVTLTATRAVGLEIATGALLWEHPWQTEYDVNAAQPIAVSPTRVFLSSGYGHGATVVELSASGQTFAVKAIWENKKMKNKFSSSVLRDGFIYGLDEGILACIDASTGEQTWKGGRYGHGQVLLAGDKLLITSEQGDVAIAKANPKQHEEVLRFPSMEGRTWNNPALENGVFYVRNLREMVAYKL